MSGSAPIRLWLITDAGLRLAVPDSEALGVLLRALSHDRVLRQTLSASGARPEALLPAGGSADEPEWLRAEEMLEEAAACPGERLFAKTLISAVNRSSAAEIVLAARALAAAVRQGTIPASNAEAVLAGCMAMASAASQLPPALPARVTESAAPPSRSGPGV